MKLRTAITTLSLALLSVSLYAQQADSVAVQYIPKIIGLLKAKWEYCLEDNTNRFDVRNSRLGFAGNINPYVSYKLQVEYSNHGDLYLLDAYASFDYRKNLSFSFGQLTIPFSEDYIVSPSQNMFANRTFIAKFINPSTRDIGALAEYRPENLPITVQAGIYNGTGINNPKWQDSPFFLGRLIYGTMKGFRTSAKYYGGEDISGKRIAQYGVDFRYAQNRYKVEAEFVVKDSLDSHRRLSGTYIQGAYRFPIKNNKTFKYVEPTLRDDAMGYDLFDNGFDISRITIGLNFGLDTKAMAAEIRLNYEHFFLHENVEALKADAYYSPFFDASDKRLFNKLTIEFLVKF